jgi:hypothetical protein
MGNLSLIYLGILISIILVINLVILIMNQRSIKQTLGYVLNGIRVDLEDDDLIQLAINIWRLEKGIKELKFENESQKKKIDSAIRKAKEWLAKRGISVNDYTGSNPEGISKVIEVISITDKIGDFQPYISNTIRPEVRINSDTVLKSRVDVAQPKPKQQFKITFNPDGGNKFIQNRIFEEGLEVNELEIPVWDGHEFLGWFDQKTNLALKFPFMVTKDVNLIAHWRETELAVKFPVETNEISFVYFYNKTDEKPLNSNKHIINTIVDQPFNYHNDVETLLDWYDKESDEKIEFPLKAERNRNFYGKWKLISKPVSINETEIPESNEKIYLNGEKQNENK